MELLKKLTKVNAVSGNEESIFNLIKTELETCAVEIHTDNMNNIIKKIML